MLPDSTPKVRNGDTALPDPSLTQLPLSRGPGVVASLSFQHGSTGHFNYRLSSEIKPVGPTFHTRSFHR